MHGSSKILHLTIEHEDFSQKTFPVDFRHALLQFCP